MFLPLVLGAQQTNAVLIWGGARTASPLTSHLTSIFETPIVTSRLPYTSLVPSGLSANFSGAPGSDTSLTNQTSSTDGLKLATSHDNRYRVPCGIVYWQDAFADGDEVGWSKAMVGYGSDGGT